MNRSDLEPGVKVSYAGFGPGEVSEIVEREVLGERKLFAVLEIPHQGMNAQLPLDNAEIIGRLREIVSPELAAKLIVPPRRAGKFKLSSNWTDRRDRVRQMLEGNDPKVWAEIYWAYAVFAATGVLLTVADLDNIDKSNNLLAAECAYALGRDFLELSADLRAAWQQQVQTLTARSGRTSTSAATA